MKKKIDESISKLRQKLGWQNAKGVDIDTNQVSYTVNSDSYYEGPEVLPDHKVERKTSPIDNLIKKNPNEDFRKKSMEYFQSRRSIRRFSPDPVPFKMIYDIILAGLNAPCAGNIQNYRIIVIEKPDVKQEIATLCYQQYWMYDAAYILILVREDLYVEKMYPNNGHLLSVQNVAAVAENIIMAAHMNDLGACWVAASDTNALKTYLNVPLDLEIDVIIPIGHMAELPKVQKAEPIGLVNFEKYGNKERK